ncbi:MAG: hypothetical protein U1E47_04655 [Rivihabitans pingtungensis]
MLERKITAQRPRYRVDRLGRNSKGVLEQTLREARAYGVRQGCPNPRH